MAAIAHPRPEKKALAVACGAHVVHDGFTDALVVLLPLWQAEFGIGYAEIGLLRSLYTGAMAAFQVPATCSPGVRRACARNMLANLPQPISPTRTGRPRFA